MANLTNAMFLGSGYPPGLIGFYNYPTAANVTKAYVNLVATGSGTIGGTSITASATVANKVQAGMIIRIGGTDTYTVSSVSTTTINIVGALSATYAALSALAVDRISQWNDSSGLGNHLTQSTALSQPIFTPAKLNGLATATGDAASTMVVPSGIWGLSNGNNTVIAVTNRTLAAAAVNRIFTLGASGSTRTSLEYTAVANTVDWQSRNASGTTVSATSFTETNFIITAAFRSGTTQSIAVNNGTATTDTNGANSSSITEGAVFSASQGTTNFLTGNIAKLLIWNRALSASEILYVVRTLSNETAITIS